MTRIGAGMLDVTVDFGGGCGIFKGLMLAALIVQKPLELAVEIGVYRGRSLVPQALAFQSVGAGKVIGIDPYSAVEARQTDDHEIPAEAPPGFVADTDWDGIYADTRERLVKLGVADYCEIRRMTSHEAAPSFGEMSVDLIHIDGNHDRAAVLDDLKSWLPKLRRGGYLVIDDASRPAIRPAIDALDESLEQVFVLDDRGLFEGGNRMDFAVYRIP
jgi:Methyltransferase domain